MAAINSTGFDPEIHLAAPELAIARVRSPHYPDRFLYLSSEGADWARGLMEQRPYFRRTWTIESKN